MQLHQNNPCLRPIIFLTYPIDKQRVRNKFMINIKDHNQAELFDNWPQLGPKRRRLLEESWAGLFQKILLPVLPVQKIAKHFNSGIGRPSKELTSSMGVLLFQQIFDLTDDETIEQLAFNMQWHYALNLPEESDSFKYISPKTLWTLRDIMIKHSIDTDIFEIIRDKIIEVFSVDTNKQRIDSVHIKSNMRKLGRIRLIANTIAKFIKNLQRHHKEQAAELSEELVKRYKPSKERQPFAMVKPSDSSKTLLDICKDLVYLLELYHEEAAVIERYSYKLMQRVSEEQCSVTESDLKTEVEVKSPKDVSSDSLQNPSDPDASYDGNKGQGYQLQLQETYTTDDKDKTVNVITHVDVEPAHKSDAKALLPAIKRTEAQNVKPTELLADSLYGGEENRQEAKKHGVDVISPLMGPTVKSSKTSLSDFTYNSKDQLLECPNHKTPVTSKLKKSRYVVCFEKDHCESCPLRESCPTVEGKKYYYLRFSKKDLSRSRRRSYEYSDEFKEKYRWRAGVEASMAEIDRKTGVKQLRVRGLVKVRFAAVLKAVGINIFRASRLRTAKNRINGGMALKNIILKLFKTGIDELCVAINQWRANFRYFSNFAIYKTH